MVRHGVLPVAKHGITHIDIACGSPGTKVDGDRGVPGEMAFGAENADSGALRRDQLKY
jgi:hypothetical protein